MLTHVAGCPLSVADAPLASSSTIVLTNTSPTSHASTKAGPLTRPRGVESVCTVATMGMGSSATATAKGRTWPIAAPIDATLTRALRRGQPALLTGSLTTSTASGAHMAAGLSACMSEWRSMKKAGTPSSAGMKTWNSR
jgi:hypothetical protein